MQNAAEKLIMTYDPNMGSSEKVIGEQPECITCSHKLRDGVIEHYDENSVLRKVEVPDGALWSRNHLTFSDIGGVAYFDSEHNLHNDNGPAVEYAGGGRRAWWIHGKRHRENGPALIDRMGTEEWYQNGELHRENGPAVTSPMGGEIWAQRGLTHRENGAAVTHPDGTQEWYLHGELHREDGPSVIYPDGSSEWISDGQRHRTDGPAIEVPSHPEKNEWWLNNQRFESESEWNQAVKEYQNGLL